MCVYVYIYVYICINIVDNNHINIVKNKAPSVDRNEGIYIYVYICIYVCVCTYICMCIYVYI
jgi:hypothetical protein